MVRFTEFRSEIVVARDWMVGERGDAIQWAPSFSYAG